MMIVTKEASILAPGCHWHPTVETGLRCNRCNRSICTKCARRTPVGYKCPSCVHHLQAVFFNGKWWDYLVALLLALPLSLFIGFSFTYLIGSIPWFSWMIAFSAAPIASGFIAEAVRWGVARRRSRHLAQLVTGCFIVAAVSFILLSLVTGGWWSGIYSSIEPGILLFVGTGTIWRRLR